MTTTWVTDSDGRAVNLVGLVSITPGQATAPDSDEKVWGVWGYDGRGQQYTLVVGLDDRETCDAWIAERMASVEVISEAVLSTQPGHGHESDDEAGGCEMEVDQMVRSYAIDAAFRAVADVPFADRLGAAFGVVGLIENYISTGEMPS